MAEPYENSHTPGTRQSLTDVPGDFANSSAKSRQPETSSDADPSSGHYLPHNESLEPNGSLAVRNPHGYAPEHKRVQTLVNQATDDVRTDSKRLSAISTTSTQESSHGRKQYIGAWQLGKTIGKGGCSRVRAVRHRYKDLYGAAKIITRKMAEDTKAQSLGHLTDAAKSPTRSGLKPIPHGLEREIVIMKLLDHENIIKLYDVWENRSELYLIMEHVEGHELFNHIDNRKGLPEDETVYIFRQIISALLYCHRLRICHRDLKPENILLRADDLCVKIIDFGMAALQPEGKLLSTPCGSPHYAAPEVVSGHPYDGTQADVWSCGVILYVMLSGTTPFNYQAEGDIRTLFRDIVRAQYQMPSDLGLEAQDLVKRIFVPNPKRRITMDEVWDHAFLHKFDEGFGFVGEDGTKEAAIGEIPTLEDWKADYFQDIDYDVLNTMRTLWHSETEHSLAEKLLNDEYNQQKLFYAALMKHREDCLESEMGHMGHMEYSGSDYHHHRQAGAEIAPARAIRSQSQYSIKGDEHLRRPSLAYMESMPSIGDYDPYRASRSPLSGVDGSVSRKVKVHRSRSQRTSDGFNSLRRAHAQRVDALRRDQCRPVNRSSSNLVPVGRSRSSLQRSESRSSLLSGSAWASSPPLLENSRPSDRNRPGVTFNHLRRLSPTDSLSSTAVKAPMTPRYSEDYRHRYPRLSGALSPMELDESSPAVMAAQAVRSRKEKATYAFAPKIRVSRPDSASFQMRSDIRKHSVELEKACQDAFQPDDAFLNGSVGSELTAESSMLRKPSLYDTPPSSIGTPNLGGTLAPPTPVLTQPFSYLGRDYLVQETPKTYLSRTLQETREKLKAYESNGGPEFDNALRLLDKLTSESSGRETRNFSAPEARTPDHFRPLPIIAEECDGMSSKESGSNWHRSVTAPIQNWRRNQDKTVRMVSPSPNGALESDKVQRKRDGSERSQSRLSARSPFGRRSALESTISLDHSLAEIPSGGVRKKRSWWNPDKKSPEDTEATLVDSSTPPVNQIRQSIHSPIQQRRAARPDATSDDSSEFPMRKRLFTRDKWGMGRFLARKNGAKASTGDGRFGEAIESTKDAYRTDDIDVGITRATQPSLDSLFDTRSLPASLEDGSGPTGHERPWFARFFHMKPVSQLMFFTLPRPRAQQELVALLREWVMYGVEDLRHHPNSNIFTARVNKQNSLAIKPISFSLELFQVHDYGKPSGMSIARMTVIKGAASGLRRIVDVLDGIMRGRGWTLENQEIRRVLAVMAVIPEENYDARVNCPGRRI